MKTPMSLIALCAVLLTTTQLDLAVATPVFPKTVPKGPPCSSPGLLPASYDYKNAVANSVVGPVLKTICLPPTLEGCQAGDPVMITPVPDNCGLKFNFYPASKPCNLGQTYTFQEMAITPPSFLSDGHVENCKVNFVAETPSGSSKVLFTQNFTVTAAAPKGCTAISCCNQYKVNTNCDKSGQCNIAAINLMDNSQVGAAQCNSDNSAFCSVVVGGSSIPGADGQPQPSCTNCPCTKKTINLKCSGASQCNLCEIDQMSGSTLGCFQCNAANGGTCSLNVF